VIGWYIDSPEWATLDQQARGMILEHYALHKVQMEQDMMRAQGAQPMGTQGQPSPAASAVGQAARSLPAGAVEPGIVAM
jgi:hypothetical protein